MAQNTSCLAVVPSRSLVAPLKVWDPVPSPFIPEWTPYHGGWAQTADGEEGRFSAVRVGCRNFTFSLV